MKRLDPLFLTVLTGAIVFTLAAGPVRAFDLRVLGDVVQRLNFDDNLDTQQNSDGEVLTSATSINLNSTLRTPRSDFSLNTGTTLRKSFGPGANSDLDTADPRVNGRYQYRGTDYTVGAHGSFTVSNTAFTETDEIDVGGFEQTITTNGETQRISYTYGADVTINVNRTDKASAFVTVSSTDFAETVAGLVPSDSLMFGGSWSTVLTRRTSASINGSMRFFNGRSDSETISLSARLSSKLTPTLSANIGAGINITETERLVAGVLQTDTSVGQSFNLSLSYVLGLTTFSASLAQNLSPSDEGDLRQRTSIAASMSHRINTKSSFTLSSYYAIQEATTDNATTATSDRNSAGFSVNYSYRLARYWNLLLGYSFRFSDTNNGAGISNAVYGSISRQFVLVP